MERVSPCEGDGLRSTRSKPTRYAKGVGSNPTTADGKKGANPLAERNSLMAEQSPRFRVIPRGSIPDANDVEQEVTLGSNLGSVAQLVRAVPS